MGSRYEVVFLGGKCYLEYYNQSTGWSTTVIEMTDEQVGLFERFELDTCNRREKLLEGFINE